MCLIVGFTRINGEKVKISIGWEEEGKRRKRKQASRE
jgi:hypothetical protein